MVLHAVEEWGIEASLVRFVGMFAFALYDRDARQLLLARDPLGIKPLYYQTGKEVLFASVSYTTRPRHAFCHIRHAGKHFPATVPGMKAALELLRSGTGELRRRGPCDLCPDEPPNKRIKLSGAGMCNVCMLSRVMTG